MNIVQPLPFFFVFVLFLSLHIYIYFPHFCSDQFFFFHYPNTLIFLYSLLCRLHPHVIFIILFDCFNNKDPRTNSSSSLHPFIIIHPSPGKSYFREVDCVSNIVDQGRFIVIFRLTLVRGQEYYRPIARGPLTQW